MCDRPITPITNGAPHKSARLKVVGDKNLRKVTINVSGTPNGNTYIAKTYPKKSTYYIVPVYNLTVSGTNESGKVLSRRWQVLRFMPYLNPRRVDKRYKLSTGDSIPAVVGLVSHRNQKIIVYDPNYEIQNNTSVADDDTVKGKFVIEGNFLIHVGPSDLNDDAKIWGSAGCMEVVGFAEMKQFIYFISGSKEKDMEVGLTKLASSGKLHLILEQAVKPILIEYGP